MVYMGILTILMIAIGLSMDAFAVSITNGIKQTSSGFKHALISALSFGVFQGIMPMLGWRLGIGFSTKIEAIDHWIAFGLLVFIGGHMIYETVSAKEEDSGVSRFNFKELMLMSLATSIDALAVGVSFSMAGVDTLAAISGASGIIAATTTVICTVGFYIGRFFGSRYKKGAEIAGGVVLILMGVKILVEHLIG